MVPGNGIGKETVPEGLRLLDAAAARRFSFDLQLTHYDWSCETYKQTSRMMPEEGWTDCVTVTPSSEARWVGRACRTTSPFGVC